MDLILLIYWFLDYLFRSIYFYFRSSTLFTGVTILINIQNDNRVGYIYSTVYLRLYKSITSWIVFLILELIIDSYVLSSIYNWVSIWYSFKWINRQISYRQLIFSFLSILSDTQSIVTHCKFIISVVLN